LTGQDRVFNIRLIGELKTQNTDHRIRNAQTKVIMDLCISGFAKVIFIHIE